VCPIQTHTHHAPYARTLTLAVLKEPDVLVGTTHPHGQLTIGGGGGGGPPDDGDGTPGIGGDEHKQEQDGEDDDEHEQDGRRRRQQQWQHQRCLLAQVAVRVPVTFNSRVAGASKTIFLPWLAYAV